MKRKRKGFAARLAAAALWALVALLVALAAGAMWAWAWLNGPEFRRLAERQIGGALGAETALQQPGWQGLSRVRAGGLIATGYDGAPVARIELGPAEAVLEPGRLAQRVLAIRSVEIEWARVVIGQPGRKGPARPRHEEAPSGIAALLAYAAAPRTVSLGPVRAARADLEWPSPIGPGSLRGTRAEARRSGGAWIVDAEGGRLKPSLLLPEFALARATARIEPGRVAIGNSELAAPGSAAGRVRVSGQIVPSLELAMAFERFDLTSLLPPERHAALAGALEGSVTLRGSAAAGEVRLAGGRLRGGAPMESAARFTGRPEYADLPLSTASASFQSSSGAGQVDVSRLVVESAGLLAVEGSFTTGGGRIDGLFELGLPPDVLRRLPGSATAVFTREERGYRWTQIRVAGPIDSPENDLVGRLIAAPINAAFKGIGNVVGRTFETGGKLVTESAGRVIETGKAAGGAAASGAGAVLEGAGTVVGGGIKLLGGGAERALGLLPFGKREPAEGGKADSGQ